MSQAWQVALGRNIPLTNFAAPEGLIDLTTPALLRIAGGLNGYVLTTNGAGVLSWEPGGGGPGGAVVTDGVSILGDGTAANPLTARVIDGGTYVFLQASNSLEPIHVPDHPAISHHDEHAAADPSGGRTERRDRSADKAMARRRRRR
jgi:hypothetical protein